MTLDPTDLLQENARLRRRLKTALEQERRSLIDQALCSRLREVERQRDYLALALEQTRQHWAMERL